MKIEIDKSEWKSVKLGDAVVKIEENDKENAKSRFDRFVKVEHMDAESLHLKRWSSQEKGDELNPYFYKVFRKGHILFPTRNPHLKRTALASFDGICGEKTLTLQPNEKLVSPEFIPFLFHSEAFYSHTTSAIIGSTNPHVRWRDVANYEFLLPPKSEQARLAKLLWAMDEVIERDREVLGRLEVIRRSYERKAFIKYRNGLIVPKGFNIFMLSDLAEISGGSTPSREKKEFWNGNIPWLTPTDVTNHNKITLSKTKEYITDQGLKSIANKIYPSGSILFCSRATIGFAVINGCPMATNQGFSNFVVNDKVDNYYLFFLLKFNTPELMRLAGGSTFLEIAKSDIRKFKVVIADKKEQYKLKNIMLEFDKTGREILTKINFSKVLQKNLINQIF